MVPLRRILSRGHSLADVESVVHAAVSTAQPVEITSGDGRRRVIGDPLLTFTGCVHGVYVWVGAAEERPPTRDPAGAWQFNLTTDRISGSDDLLDLYGVAPADRQKERVTAEAFGRLVANADESRALAMLVRSEPGAEHQATWTVRRDDGQLRAAHFSCRTIAEPVGDGATEVVLRGITHDIGPAESTPSALPPVVLAQQVLAGLAEPGLHRAIVNLRTFRLLRWLDDPMPGIAWEYDPDEPTHWIHPDDLPVAQALAEGLAKGKTRGRLRFRTTPTGWQEVDVDAALVILDQNTTAALLTLRDPGQPTDLQR
jgi:hypothetical protein